MTQSSLRVLMYHATYADSDALATIDSADQPYAVAESDFISHVKAMQDAGYAIKGESGVHANERDTDDAILLTFDDGHRSNATFAAQWLAENALSGLFFITTDWTDQRPHYCTAGDLRAMHALGMGIGSHGCSHRFIADLDTEQARNEIRDSKAKLEDILGCAVNSFSFPGGRCSQRDIDLAFDAGFVAVHGSRFGLHRPGAHQLISRLPIRQGMSASTVMALCNPASWLHRRVIVSTYLKTTAKRVLGNGVYDAIYLRFSA